MDRETYDILREKGVLAPIDVHFAALMEKLAGDEDPCLFLGAALVSRSTREGHVCLDLSERAGTDLLDGGGQEGGLVCPDLETWCRALRKSEVVGRPGQYRPLILDDKIRLYLFRYWDYQEGLARSIRERAREDPDPVEPAWVREVLGRLFPDGGARQIDWQKVSALTALTKRFSVISGGPGTGKTATVAKILVLLLERAGKKGLRIALTCPTGKGAARMEETLRVARDALNCAESVKEALPKEASTIHRLLGGMPGSSSFRHNPLNPLEVDVVVVDEASMVDLALMSSLVRALPSKARLILLGDKDQLASVEAGAVLGDICNTGRPRAFSRSFARVLERGTGYRIEGRVRDEGTGGIGDCVVQLEKNYRFGSDSGIHAVSRAVKDGEGELAVTLLKEDIHRDITWKDSLNPKSWPVALRETIVEGFRACFLSREPREVFRALDNFRILCALREGPYGVAGINASVEKILREADLLGVDRGPWYAGRPILVTRNDYPLRLFNGDVGVVLPDPGADGELRAFFPGQGGMFRSFHPMRLPEHETVYAMTVHKSQGSEFREVLILLPDRDTPVLTRELLYTAITRARDKVTLWGPERVLRTAIARRIERRSGLREALWGEIRQA